jgi:hypothetical protein
VIYIGQGFIVPLVIYPAWWFENAGGGRFAVHCRLPTRRRAG